MMEDSHFNSSYFWSTIPAVPGQVRLSVISLFSCLRCVQYLHEAAAHLNKVFSLLADRERHVPEQGEGATREERFLSAPLCIPLPNGTSYHPHLWGKDRWRRAVKWATPPPSSQQPEHVASSLYRHHDSRWVSPWAPPSHPDPRTSQVKALCTYQYIFTDWP